MATIRKKIYDTESKVFEEPKSSSNEKPENVQPITQTSPDDPPSKPAQTQDPAKQTDHDKIAVDIKTFDDLYGAYNTKPAVKDYTPEEKAAMEKKAKRARWADAAVVMGRALQGKDTQLDKTQSMQIREKMEARNKAYMDAVERNNANKAAWELTRNQERIRWYQKELDRGDLNSARKQEYETKLQELKLQQDKLALAKDELNLAKDELKARKDGTYYENKDGKKTSPGSTAKTNTTVAQTAFESQFPETYTGLSNYIASAMSQGKYTSGEERGYVANWMNRFADANGNYNIPAPIITEINDRLARITNINEAIEKHRRGEDISDQFPDPTQLRKILKDEKKGLTDYLSSAQPSTKSSQSGTPISTQTVPISTSNQNNAVKEKWGVN